MNTENIYYTYYHFFPSTGQFYIGKAIKCNETGIIFKSIYDLCKEMKLHNSHIYRQLKGKLKTVKGYTFSRV